MLNPARLARHLLFPLAIAGGCGDVAIEDFHLLPGASRPIIHGDAPIKPTDDAVGALLMSVPGGLIPFCSGTLIAPRTFLTAGHCVDDGFGPGDYVFFGDRVRGPLADHGTLVDVVAVRAHPQYDPETLARDIAVVELAEDPPGVAPVPALPPDLGMVQADRGTSTRLAGFGKTEANFSDSGAPLMEPKRQTTVRVTAICPRVGPCDWTTMIGTFQYEHGDTGACNGDSGGPAFWQRDDTTYVAGVNSSIGALRLPSGEADCMNAWVGTETLVSDYFDFIVDFMQQRGLSMRNHCADDPCDALVSCTNLVMSHLCGSCPNGYDDIHGDGTECRDIDECEAGLDDCATDIPCTNTPGAYECANDAAYANNDDTQSETLGGIDAALPGPLTNAASCAAQRPLWPLAALALLALALQRSRRRGARSTG